MRKLCTNFINHLNIIIFWRYFYEPLIRTQLADETQELTF